MNVNINFWLNLFKPFTTLYFTTLNYRFYIVSIHCLLIFLELKLTWFNLFYVISLFNKVYRYNIRNIAMENASSEKRMKKMFEPVSRWIGTVASRRHLPYSRSRSHSNNEWYTNHYNLQLSSNWYYQFRDAYSG